MLQITKTKRNPIALYSLGEDPHIGVKVRRQNSCHAG